MRLLIYLLALVSGFSAAEAARAEVSPASSVSQTAVAAAEALASQVQEITTRPANQRPGETMVSVQTSDLVALVASTPVTRNDISRQ
jgi:hypothetical protein